MCNKTYAHIFYIYPYKLCHKRSGYIERSKFIKMKQHNLIDDKNLIESIIATKDLCETCIFGKKYVCLSRKKKTEVT